jgi:hypothetical protein
MRIHHSLAKDQLLHWPLLPPLRRNAYTLFAAADVGGVSAVLRMPLHKRLTFNTSLRYTRKYIKLLFLFICSGHAIMTGAMQWRAERVR